MSDQERERERATESINEAKRRWLVRHATRDDIELLADFNCAMALETEQLTLERDRVRAGVSGLLEEPSRGRCFVIEDRARETGVNDGASRVVGTLSVTSEWSDWRCGTFWWIQSVYVAPSARRSGAFRALYGHVEALARGAPDVCGLRLYVERDNARAMRTYAALGMAETHYRIYETEFETEFETAFETESEREPGR